MYFKHLPLPVLLLVIDTCSARLSPREIVDHVHHTALAHTKRFAKDLRTALRSINVLVEDVPGSVSHIGKRAVYCTITDKGAISAGDPGGTTNSPSANPSATSNTTSTTTKGATSSKGATSTTTATPSQVSASPWKLIESHSGSNFFDGWEFFTNPDPTNGIVHFVDQPTANANNLASINSRNNAIMAVETTETVANLRNSVRITTKSSFTGGLVIMDSVHMPTGCGTWPAFWTNGPQWPAGGEIDIIEGVGDYTNVQATIHTNPGCTVASASSAALGMSGTLVGGQDCAVVSTGNQGCGVRAKETNSYGAAFNSNGGGVYAMKWDTTGISIYFFARGSIPSDISAGTPTPSGWGLPVARWPAAQCPPFQFFNSHSVIIDTTLCGDWASGVWSAAGIPGQETSCAARTGYSTCEAFVRANGASFAEAYWEVNYVKIYQLK